MENFVTFRHKSNGVIKDYPEHYATHPVFGDDLERYDPSEYEEDKVVVSDHDLPVEQRAVRVAESRYEDMPVSELKEILAERGLSTSGKKDELVERLGDSNTDNDIEVN